MHWRNLTFNVERSVAVGAVVLLVILGFVLPYLTMEYINFASEIVTRTVGLTEAASLLGGLDPTYITGYELARRDNYTLALNVMAAAPNIQQVTAVIVAVACFGLFADEINKFMWWPLHLAAYPLLLTPIPLFIGLNLLRAQDVTVSLGLAWIPGALAGAVALFVSLRARKRLDTYGGI